MALTSEALGLLPQYSTTISVEVGLHHASPPLSNSGYSPRCTSCEYCGTSSVTPSAPPSAPAATDVSSGNAEAIAPTERTIGADVVPCVRYSVTRSRYDVSATRFAARNVSIAIVPSASPCPPSDVRWMSPLASDGIRDVQRPMTYHFVGVPAVVVPCISSWIQVPAGVSTVQLETSSVSANVGA